MLMIGIYLLLLAGAAGIALIVAASRWQPRDESLIEQINAILPQTQCAQCGYPGCRPYAQAIADGEANINQCPPGGDAGIHQLSVLLDISPLPLDASCGEHKPPILAVIDEGRCIGCTLCIQACPVDAIVGAGKRMHSVIAKECTGCELCLPPCPVDCIDLIPIPQSISFDTPGYIQLANNFIPNSTVQQQNGRNEHTH